MPAGRARIRRQRENTVPLSAHGWIETEGGNQRQERGMDSIMGAHDEGRDMLRCVTRYILFGCDRWPLRHALDRESTGQYIAQHADVQGSPPHGSSLAAAMCIWIGAQVPNTGVHWFAELPTEGIFRSGHDRQQRQRQREQPQAAAAIVNAPPLAMNATSTTPAKYIKPRSLFSWGIFPSVSVSPLRELGLLLGGEGDQESQQQEGHQPHQ